MSKQCRQLLRDTVRYTCSLLVVVVLVGTVFPSYATAATNQQQAVEAALKKNGGGKVLNVSTKKDDSGRQIFVVKILSGDGRMRIVQIPQS